MLEITTPVAQGPFEWLLHWLPAVGWPAVISIVGVAAWKLRGMLDGMEARAKAMEESVHANAGLIRANSDLTRDAAASVGKLAALFEQHTRDDDRNFGSIFETLKSNQEQFRALLELLNARTQMFGDISGSIRALAEAIHHQADVHASQFDIIRGIAERQATLAANQEHITQGFQRVVEQLISLMKE
jgi:hypothetical protein